MGNGRFVQSIIRERLQDDSCRMIRALTGMIRMSKLLCCLICFFQVTIKLPYLPASCVGTVRWFWFGDYSRISMDVSCNCSNHTLRESSVKQKLYYTT